MPYSFTQIEKDKTRTIGLVFSFLIFFYFLTFWLIGMIVVNAQRYNDIPYLAQDRYTFSLLDWPTTLLILAIALVVGLGHWYFTTYNLVPKILRALGAEPLNEKDAYHKMFRNILDEVSVATGGKKIEGVVIPTMAMNAFAISDFQGRDVIGTTEGVLSRLTRAQIEAVVGHEAAHVVSGDCLATTVTSSLFELYSGLLKGMELMFRGSGRSSYRSSSRSSGGGGGGIVAIIVLVYLLLLITKFLSYLVRMFISREREYRADAIAVRLTRDPLSLAEALYAIGYHWRGQGLPAQEMESIFIINPQYAYLDEHEGFLANLFATHPPMENRIGILLNMARVNIEQVVERVKIQSVQPRSHVPQAVGIDTKWKVQKDGQWHGPFELVQMATFDWITPQTWIQRLDGSQVQRAFQDETIAGVISHTGKSTSASQDKCPRCKLPLAKVIYEGTEVDKCPFCQGVLAGQTEIQRIIIRHTVGFSDEIKRIGEGIKKAVESYAPVRINRDPRTLLICPRCHHPGQKMHRMFYTEVYRVEVDKCFACGSYWFDKDELELLQYLIEGATAQTEQ